jgi:hypothetical protein
MARRSHSFRIRRSAEEVIRDRTAPASEETTCIWGRDALLTSGILVHHRRDCDATLTEYSSQRDTYKISFRYLPSSSLLLSNDGHPSLMQKSTVMKNEKLKSTTVRFTDSDLRLIDCLQEKLGLGMIHIIRLAIRRLAENENLLLSNSGPSKR